MSQNKCFFILIIFLLSSSNQLFACANEYESGANYTGKSGVKYDFSNIDDVFPDSNSINLIELQEKTMGMSVETNKEELNNIAVLYMKAGYYNQSIILLQLLLAKYPEDYIVLANIGTANELIGDNLKALEYLQKALSIDSTSHQGTEYVHVEILKAKIGLEKSEHFLDNRKIIETDLVSMQLGLDIRYQLIERAYFIKPINKMMAQLFLESILAFASDKEGLTDAIELCELVILYDDTKKAEIELLRTKLEDERILYFLDRIVLPIIYFVVLILVVLIGVSLIKKRNKRLARQKVQF